MRRREFITLFGGAAAWPLAARAQQANRVRRVGILQGRSQSDSESVALVQQLHELGWNDQNLKLEQRFVGDDVDRFRDSAAELVKLEPDLIVVQSNPGLAALRQQTRQIPIVFLQVADPVGSGFIESLARPGGNATGFTNFETAIGGKWLELLKEAAPRIARVAVLFHPETAANVAFLHAAEAAAPSFRIPITPIGVHGVAEIDDGIAKFAAESNGGMIVMPHIVTAANRVLVAQLAARNRLPAVYPFRFFAEAGGLMSYGADSVDLWRRTAFYVDRILKGEKPANLPVQAPVKFEMVINDRAAKAIDLIVPPILLARADEVIE